MDPITSRLFRNCGRKGSLVLMYHSVTAGADTPDWPYAVSMKNFCAQLDLLKREGWKTYGLSELATRSLPARSVVITFDDGYQDNFAAFEALARRGMTASWFIVSRDIGAQTRWRDAGTAQAALLDAAQLCEMHAAGMEIGAHGHTHQRLTECDDRALIEELTVSKTTLEAVLQTPVTTLAYPYGAYDARVLREARAAGYAAACTTRTGWAMGENDPLMIRRLSIFAQDTLGSFARKLAFADNEGSWRRLVGYAQRRTVSRVTRALGFAR